MKSLILILAFTPSYLFAQTYAARRDDGRIVFAKYLVGETMAFSDAERDAILLAHPGAPVMVLPLDPYALAASTSGLKFDNFSDFDKCIQSTGTIVDKMADLKPSETNKMTDTIPYLNSKIQSVQAAAK